MLQASVDPTSKAEVRWSAFSHSARVSERKGELMSESANVAPSWESLMLVPRPMPLAAPVTMMILLVNGLDILNVL